MQLTLKQLDKHLDKHLYLCHGDEPLLLEEARNTLVSGLVKKGFEERQRCYLEQDNKLEQLISMIQNQDLFSSKKIIDLRYPSGKFDAAMTKLIEKYCKDQNPMIVMIITTDKLTPQQQKSPCYQCIEKQGHIFRAWPISNESLPQWIIDRGKQRYHLAIEHDAAKTLAFFSEGHLLSADQALMKLALNQSEKQITHERLLTVLSDHARFNVFDLGNALEKKQLKKCLRILERLYKSGEEPILMLWSICRTLRAQRNYRALQKAATIDEILKGAYPGNIKIALETLIMMGCGYVN